MCKFPFLWKGANPMPMYPDLSYILHDLVGTQPDNVLSIVKTFGLFLIFAFLASAWILRLEFLRKEREGIFKATIEKVIVGRGPRPQDLLGNGILGFILGFKLPYIVQHFAEFKADAAAVLLTSEGNFLVGILAAALLAYLKYRDLKAKALPKPEERTIKVQPHQRIGDITILAAISGIVGAKIAAIFESTENIQSFLRDPVRQLLSGSGLAIYGGLILAFIVVVWYVRKKKMPVLHVMDAAAPALIMGYAVGRIGCQLSGDGDWGIVNALSQPGWWFLPDWMWAYDYPHNVINEGVAIEGCTWQYCSRLAEPVYPTPFYETLMGFVIFAILWVLRKPLKIPGMLFFIYTIFNGVERFLIEKIRVNPDIEILGLHATQAEYIAFLLIIVGIAGCFWTWRRSAKEPT